MGIIEAIETTRDVAASNWHASDEERTAMNMVADLIAAYDIATVEQKLRLERAIYALVPHLLMTQEERDELEAELEHEAEYQRTLDAGFTTACPICGMEH
jgi:hypothetical protein